MTTISNHPRLNPTKQRLIAFFVRIILVLNVILSVGLLIIAMIYVLPLLVLTVVFIVALTVPFIGVTSLHPGIEVREDGLYLTPLVWPRSFIEWSDISHLTVHPMLKPAPPSQIPLINKIQQEGFLVVCTQAASGWHYRIIGIITGQGFTPSFAFSNHTHTDYKQLRHELKRRLDLKDTP